MATAADSECSPWSQRLISELEAADGRAERLARGLNRAQLNWRPTPGAWSVGQCLEHLVIANEVYLSPISTSLDSQHQSQVGEVTPGWFSRWFIRNYIAPSSKGKSSARRKIQPPKIIESSVLEAFLRSNGVARELIAKAGDYDVNRIRFKNPFVPMLRFTVGTGLEILSKHQSRHLLQAERVKQSAQFPSDDTFVGR